MTIYDIFIKIQKNILEKPHTCEICGAKETLDNIMIEYDNSGMLICEDCMIELKLNERKGS